jgi:hypothetical protein
VDARTTVDLPPDVTGSFEVFVNGVLQHEGRDYRRQGDTLAFSRALAREGRLGFWRWLSIVLGIAGTYRQDDSVDVVYERGGRRVVATGLRLRAD